MRIKKCNERKLVLKPVLKPVVAEKATLQVPIAYVDGQYHPAAKVAIYRVRKFLIP